jgi:ketosteroid isomerase-like protein
MTADRPEKLHELLAARVSSGDLAGIMDLYEEDATYDGGRAGRLAGLDAIGDYFRGMLGLHPTLELRTRKVISTGKIALLACDWRLCVSPGSGELTERTGTSVEVARRQPDGTWRYVIDEPTFLG